MSDIGLYGSVYRILYAHTADRLDQSLIGLRNPDTNIAKHARSEIVQLLREITDNNSTNPATRLVSVISGSWSLPRAPASTTVRAHFR